jgi:hypothetical protein
MKAFIQILAAGVICAFSFAQDASTPQTNPAMSGQQNQASQSAQTNAGTAGGTPRLAVGSVIPVQLSKTIDAKKLKSGDAIEARVTQDLKTQGGEVLVPKDTRISGRVTEVQAHTKEQQESQIGIAFDHATIKNGPEMQLAMSIQAIIAPPSSNSNNGGETPAPSSSMPSNSGAAPSGRSAGMGGSQPQAQNPSPTGGDWPASSQSSNAPAITGSTQGVIGFSNLKLSAGANATSGSIVSSEKSNVKLESGTLMLLRVNQ